MFSANRSGRALHTSGNRKRVARLAAAAAAFWLGAASAVAQTKTAAGPLVHLKNIDPSIIQEMRYATPHNFTGKVVKGYKTPACLLIEDAARALANAQRALAEKKLSLKVFDCYRPQMAVEEFIRWVDRGRDNPAYHPAIERRSLIARGYIASRSSHAKGISVDLTVTTIPTAAHAVSSEMEREPCTTRPPPHGELDMGTAYDCFDAKSSAAGSGLSTAQLRNRKLLRDVMVANGFEPYGREWWHFTFKTAKPPRTLNQVVE